MYIGRPKRAARRAVALLVPPIIRIGCGLVSGTGVTLTISPKYSNGSPVHALSRVSTQWSISLPRPAQSFWWRWYSLGR